MYVFWTEPLRGLAEAGFRTQPGYWTADLAESLHQKMEISLLHEHNKIGCTTQTQMKGEEAI